MRMLSKYHLCGEQKNIYDVMMKGGKAGIAVSVETTKFRGGYHCNGGAD
jgi:hypothetical protein